MKTLIDQFVTFWFAINELPVDSGDSAQGDELYFAVHARLEGCYRALPGASEQLPAPDSNITVGCYELCAADGLIEERNGVLAWPVCLYASKDVAAPALAHFKDLAVKVFEEESQRLGLGARLVAVEKLNYYRVCETETLPL